jgi:hypothetical protein
LRGRLAPVIVPPMQTDPPGFRPLAPPPQSAAALLRTARGCSCLFWGQLFGVLLSSGTLRWGDDLPAGLPPFAPGLALMLWGSLLLRWTPAFTPEWPQRTERLLLAGLLTAAFAPFFTWWNRLPQHAYFAANVALLAVTLAWLTHSIHALAGEAARALQVPVLRMEARVGQAATTIAAAVTLGLAGVLVARHWGVPVDAWPAMGRALGAWPHWILAPLLLPVFMAMSVAWETKEWCLQRVREAAP